MSALVHIATNRRVLNFRSLSGVLRISMSGLPRLTSARMTQLWHGLPACRSERRF